MTEQFEIEMHFVLVYLKLFYTKKKSHKKIIHNSKNKTEPYLYRFILDFLGGSRHARSISPEIN